jgi:predicted transcriptional regulator
MKKNLQLHVGESLDEVGQRVIDAWHRAERGDLKESEYHVSFEDFATFAAVMTPKRLELLRHVHRAPPRSIRALAQALGRDYRRVHEDVEVLANAGLLNRDAEGLRADYDTVHLDTRIAL